MSKQTIFVTLSVCTTAIVITAINAGAGPLTPPPGPVAPTPEIEPRTAVNADNTPGDADSLFKITQPGSYYLTGNITGVAGLHGIEIAAHGVTLDLNGFELLGAVGSREGVTVSPGTRNIRIHNGSVRGWGGAGVNAINATNSTLRDLVASGNGFDGMRIGANSVVKNCAATSNTGVGIFTSTGAAITGCASTSNSGRGIFASDGAAIIGCTASFNSVSGVVAGLNSTITNCSATSNGGTGFFASNSSLVRGCVARSNGTNGIHINPLGTVTACSATQNGIDGIFARSGSTISYNTVNLNTNDGIQASGDAFVLGNTCDSNGAGAHDGAGILVTGSDTRVEGNNVTDNDRGIDVDASGNLIIRNSASGNTVNYTIVISNKVGVIVNAPNSLAINGSTGGGGVGSTNPWANFSF